MLHDNNNILLITDYEEIAKLVLEKLILLRDNDRITVCNSQKIKKTLENSLCCIVILHENSENPNVTIKLISTIKETKPEAEVILLLNKENKDLILRAYDAGIYDYFTTETPDYEILIKTINCFKLRTFKDTANRNEKFLYQLGVIDNKNNLYKYNYLKEIFIDLSDDLRIQNGVFAILTLDDKTKTKISTNRLAGAIKNCVRQDDIVATARGGKFYLIIPNIDIEGTKAVIQKIQNKMGDDFKIRSGLSKIGIQSFETLDKNTLDSLTSAIQNDVMCVSLSDNMGNSNSWLEEDNKSEKSFKLFKMAFTKKLKEVITPVFFRFQKECETKLTNTNVSQYANSIECVFSLKNENIHSELILRYNGFAKIKIEIVHSGLDSAENSKVEMPLSKLTEKELLKLLKQLKDEYKQSAYK